MFQIVDTNVYVQFKQKLAVLTRCKELWRRPFEQLKREGDCIGPLFVDFRNKEGVGSRMGMYVVWCAMLHMYSIKPLP